MRVHADLLRRSQRRVRQRRQRLRRHRHMCGPMPVPDRLRRRRSDEHMQPFDRVWSGRLRLHRRWQPLGAMRRMYRPERVRRAGTEPLREITRVRQHGLRITEHRGRGDLVRCVPQRPGMRRQRVSNDPSATVLVGVDRVDRRQRAFQSEQCGRGARGERRALAVLARRRQDADRRRLPRARAVAPARRCHARFLHVHTAGQLGLHPRTRDMPTGSPTVQGRCQHDADPPRRTRGVLSWQLSLL